MIAALNSREAKALTKILSFLRDESGATAIEYGLLLGLIVIAAVGAFNSFASTVTTMWSHVSSNVSGAISGGP